MFVSCNEMFHHLGQLNVCANGMQLQGCDISNLNTHSRNTQATHAPSRGKCRTKIPAKIYFWRTLVPTWEYSLKSSTKLLPFHNLLMMTRCI